MNIPAASGPKDGLPTALVFFAVKEEAAPLRSFASSHRDLQVVVTGMGMANARNAALQAIASAHPHLVLTCGFAGGLNPALVTGDVVFDTDSEALASGLLAAGGRRSTFHCVSQVAVTAREKFSLRQQTGKDAVEMESEIIRSIAAQQGIPSATVRVILDRAEEDLPLNFNLLVNASQEIQLSKLALTIAKSPHKIPALISFGRNSRSAALRLSKVLERFISINREG